jgi:fluoride exporter
VHLHWRSVLLVFVGGALGTTVRSLLSAAVPAVGGIPIITFAINVVGAFVLGWLLESLALRGPDEGRRRDARLFVGTGILGGFTTYSAFAVDTDGLIVAANVGGSILYAVATIVVGAAASIAGIATGAAIGRRKARS